jgi:GNAT superfamily N-acetyltransferase
MHHYWFQKAQHRHHADLVDMIYQVALESEGCSLDLETLSQGIRQVLDNPALGTYWLLFGDTPNDKPLACMLTTTEWSDWHNKAYLWLQSVYISPEYRGQGLMNLMIERLAELVEPEGVSELRLYVDQGNHRALQAYTKCQFSPSNYLMMSKSLATPDV